MGDIATKIVELNTVKSSIKSAIENKGVDMTNVPFTEYASKIDEIKTEETYSLAGTGSSSTSLSVNSKMLCGSFFLTHGFDSVPTMPTLYAVIDGSNIEINSTNFTIKNHTGTATSVRDFINDKAYKDSTITQLKFNSTVNTGKYQISCVKKA